MLVRPALGWSLGLYVLNSCDRTDFLTGAKTQLFAYYFHTPKLVFIEIIRY